MTTKNKVRVLIQARTNSRRLYAKVINNLQGIPLVHLCYKRVFDPKNYETFIATSSFYEDDILCSYLKKHRIPFFRHNLENVFNRFIRSTKDLDKNDILVRLTADNPLVDKKLVNFCIDQFKSKKLKYFSSHNNIFNTPYGLQVEVFKIGSLREVNKKKINIKDKEHVTHSIKKKYLNKFIKVNYGFKKEVKLKRVTVDNLNDLLNVNNIFFSNKDILVNSNKIKHTKNTKSLKKNYNNKLVLGTVQLGKKYFSRKNYNLTQKRANQILSCAFKNNINIIDTARDYGQSEKFIGNFISKTGKKFLICTKLKPLKGIRSKKKTINFINKNIFESLINLKSNQIKYFLIHDVKDIEKKYLINHLMKYVDSGVINNLGVSIYNIKDYKKIVKVKKLNFIQLPINLLDHRCIEIINNSRFKIFARSILLRGNIKKDHVFLPKKLRENKKILQVLKYYKFSNYIDLAISFVKAFKKINYFIFGINNINQLRQIVKVFNLSSPKKINLKLFINNIKKLNLGNKVDLRYW